MNTLEVLARGIMMEGIIIGILFSMGMMIKFVVILCKYEAIKGISY